MLCHETSSHTVQLRHKAANGEALSGFGDPTSPQSLATALCRGARSEAKHLRTGEDRPS